MWKVRTFYTLIGLSLAMAILFALAISLSNVDKQDVSKYPKMTSAERRAEYQALQAEAARPHFGLTSYFNTQARFDRLKLAIRRARKEELPTYNRNVELPGQDEVQLSFLRDEYTANTQGTWSTITFTDEEREKAIAAVGFPKEDYSLRTNPALPWAWATVYCLLFILTLGRFNIQMREMGGRPWLMLWDLRFYLWLIVCLPGIFRYPKKVDMVAQLKRAYRFGTLLITSSLTMGAAACAGKQVRTGQEERRKNAPHALHVDVSTTTLPYYLGGDGAVFHPAPVQQTIATVSTTSGLYGGLWHSLPLGGFNLRPNYGHEVDLFSGWSGPIKGLQFTGDATYVGVVPLQKYRGDVWQFTTDVGRSFKMVHGQTLTPEFRFRFAVPARGDQPPGGRFFRESLGWSWQPGRFEITVRSGLLHDSGAFGFGAGWFSDNTANINVKLGPHLKLGVPMSFMAPVSRLHDARHRQLQAGLSLGWHQ